MVAWVREAGLLEETESMRYLILGAGAVGSAGSSAVKLRTEARIVGTARASDALRSNN
jgi:hypothetical protein